MSHVIVHGIKFDEKSSFLGGARHAPSRIRQILTSGSSNSFAENGIDTDSDLVIDKGDFRISEYFDIEKISSSNLEPGGKLLTLGGDHSITYPIMRAFSKFYSGFDILQIDAHPDLYNEFEGDKYSHACPFARIMEDNLVDRLVQIGIRSVTNHLREQAENYHVEMFEMKDWKNFILPEFNNPVYLSIDMDAFDPAFSPGVSHHEPGGLMPREVIDLINNLDAEIIGADIVEYNPEKDVESITGALAAKLMKEIIGRMIKNI